MSGGVTSKFLGQIIDTSNVWGSIIGDITTQTDLQDQFDTKLDNSAIGTTTQVRHGNATGLGSFGSVVEADISLSNNTTNNASLTKHGFLDQLPGGTTVFKRGDGAWAVPTGVSVPNGYVTESFAYTSGVEHTITHNFGTYPVVQLFDNTGYQVIPYSIQNTDTNTVSIVFTTGATYTAVLTLGSPPYTNITSTAIDYTALATDYTIRVTASGKTITLPTAVGRSGKIFRIKNSSTGVINVTGTGGQTLEGVAIVNIAAGDALDFFSNNTNYEVF